MNFINRDNLEDPACTGTNHDHPLDCVHGHKNQAGDRLIVEKLNTEYFTIEATEGATMDVDDEDATDRQHLQELVRKQSEAKSKSLQQDLKKLQQQVKGLQSSTANNS
jgi:hypothetical protein